MSLRDVKVGDEVVVEERFRPHRVERVEVSAVGRKYITAGEHWYNRTDGARQGRKYITAGEHWYNRTDGARQDMPSGLVVAHTVAQWERREAEAALTGARRRLCNSNDFSALTDDEVRDLTATLTAAAEKMEKKP